jgi:hypothetical protein
LEHEDCCWFATPFAYSGMGQERSHGHTDYPGPNDNDFSDGPRFALVPRKAQWHRVLVMGDRMFAAAWLQKLLSITTNLPPFARVRKESPASRWSTLVPNDILC